MNLEAKDSIRHYHLRHMIKPGITGWAQVNGCRGETSDPDALRRRVEMDIWYIENWSFVLDIKIVLSSSWLMIKAIRAHTEPWLGSMKRSGKFLLNKKSILSGCAYLSLALLFSSSRHSPAFHRAAGCVFGARFFILYMGRPESTAAFLIFAAADQFDAGYFF